MPRLEDAWTVHSLRDPALSESSGLVRSRAHGGVFWTHNDSGDRPRIFAVDASGETLAEFEVAGAAHVDWEDIAIDDAGHLWIGDFGNNDNERRDLVVYRVPEPDPHGGSGTAEADRALRFRYADQTAWPDRSRLDFDAEALFWLDGALWIFTKHRSDTQTTLYRLATDANEAEQVLEPRARIDLGGEPSRLFGNTTAADASPDGRWIALLTYRAVHLWQRSGDLPVPAGPVARIRLDPRRTRQVESLAWDGGALLIGNEQRRIFRIPDPLDPALHRYPPPR
jgi:hypothetical protein